MKIAHATGGNEKEAINLLLNNFRNTPHPATGLSPSSMLFRDGEQSVFPRKTCTDQEVKAARKRDMERKSVHQQQVNAGKYRIPSQFKIGDQVLVRNYQKTRKFDPTFQPKQFLIVDITNNGQCLSLLSPEDGTTLVRHPDDVKRFEGSFLQQQSPPTPSEEHTVMQEYMSLLSQAVAQDTG